MAINLADKLTSKTVEGIVVDSSEVFYNDAMGIASSGNTVAAKLYEIDLSDVKMEDLDVAESGETTTVIDADFATVAMKDGNGNILSEMSTLAIGSVQHQDPSEEVTDIDESFQTVFEAKEAARDAANQAALELNASLSGLTTTNKSSLVAAINEVNNKGVILDSALSTTSTNGVQNKVIANEFATVVHYVIPEDSTTTPETANNAVDTFDNGTFAQKPTLPPIGYSYFCTDKKTTEGGSNGIMIFHKGNNVWVDALGRVVS